MQDIISIFFFGVITPVFVLILVLWLVFVALQKNFGWPKNLSNLTSALWATFLFEFMLAIPCGLILALSLHYGFIGFLVGMSLQLLMQIAGVIFGLFCLIKNSPKWLSWEKWINIIARKND